MHYWQAFWDLNTERQVSMSGALPIPVSAIKQYGREEFPRDPYFCEIMRIMDEEYLTGKRAFSRDQIRRDV